MKTASQSFFAMLYYRLMRLSLMNLSMKQSLFLFVVLITALLGWVKQIGVFELAELMVFDQFTELSNAAIAHGKDGQNRILVVEITEDDLLRQKQWPLTDATLAQVINTLQKYQPRAIGLDLYRNIPQGEGLTQLETALSAENVIAIYDAGARIDAPAAVPPERQGFNDLIMDQDGVVRRHLLYAYQGDQEYYSLSLRLALAYLESEGYQMRRSPDALTLGNTRLPALGKNSGAYQNLDAAGYQMLLMEPIGMNIDHLPISLVLEGAVPPELVRDRLVLIGSTAPSLKDYFRTAQNHRINSNKANKLAAGVDIHAQQTNQLLNFVLQRSKPLHFWREWQELIWIFVWGLVGAMIVRSVKNFSLLMAFELLAGGVLTGTTFLLFQNLIWIPLISPLLGLYLSSVMVLAYKLIDTSFVDPLTGLPNRQQFCFHLRFAIRQANQIDHKRFAVLFLGIDRFNIINDSFGYATGDRLLLEIAQRVQQTLNKAYPNGLLARVGGDEFAILLSDLHHADQAQNLAQDLQPIIQEPFLINSNEIILSCCMGIALSEGGENYEPEQLLRNAHTAMYRAKLLGRSSYEVFAIAMKKQITQQLEMETDLRHALARQELELYYQPLVDLHQCTLIGFEALVRWNHPKGMISPYHFIPIAEETGLIIPIGQWIIQTACTQMKQWHTQFPHAQHLGLSINISGKQFSHPNLIKDIRNVLTQTQLSADCLKMEVTESIAMQNVEASIDLLLQLKELGLKLSIDDFGTGYSSLSYLCQFPIDTLKIDRSFVNRMQQSDADFAIVQTIVTLSHALGMTIVAEGIETVEQRKILTKLGCEFGQGYLFAKPLTVAQAAILIRDNQSFSD